MRETVDSPHRAACRRRCRARRTVRVRRASSARSRMRSEGDPPARGTVRGAQPRAGFDAQLLEQDALGVVIGPDRLRVPAHPPQRRELAHPDGLVQRVVGDEPRRAEDHLVVLAEREPRVEQGVPCRRPPLVQLIGRGGGQRTLPGVHQRVRAPQRERFLQDRRHDGRGGRRQAQPSLHEVPEAVGVDGRPVHVQPVSGIDRLDRVRRNAVRLQPAAEPADVGVHRVGRVPRRVRQVQLFDEFVPPNTLAGPQREHGENVTELGPAQLHLRVVHLDSQRSEYPDTHGRQGSLLPQAIPSRARDASEPNLSATDAQPACSSR